MFGLFSPVGAPSTDLPGPFSTLYAEYRGENCAGEWKVSEGCTTITPVDKCNLLFQFD